MRGNISAPFVLVLPMIVLNVCDRTVVHVHPQDRYFSFKTDEICSEFVAVANVTLTSDEDSAGAPPSSALFTLQPAHRDDEHALILQYCQTLGGEGSPCSQPQSPAQILQAVEREERGELERVIARLEEEQR